MTATGGAHGDVHVWTVRTDVNAGMPVDAGMAVEAGMPVAIAAAVPFPDVLSAEERQRADALTDTAARRDFVAAHTLARLALTACHPAIRPGDWVFAATEHGRPLVVAAGQDLRLSLTHAAGVVACAVAYGVDCGIDVEPIAATGPRRRVLTGEEADAVAACAPEKVAELYARLWTMKEAYGKARGLGFLLPFDQLQVTPGPPAALEDRTRSATDGGWHVEQWQPTPSHVASLAVLDPRPHVVHAQGFPG